MLHLCIYYEFDQGTRTLLSKLFCVIPYKGLGPQRKVKFSAHPRFLSHFRLDDHPAPNKKGRAMPLSTWARSLFDVSTWSPTRKKKTVAFKQNVMAPPCLKGPSLPQSRPGPPDSLSGLRPRRFQLLGKTSHVYFMTCA